MIRGVTPERMSIMMETMGRKKARRRRSFTREFEEVMLEIDWIGGDPTSNKGGPPPTRDDIDLYCADGTPEQIHSMSEWLAKNREILRIGDETAS